MSTPKTKKRPSSFGKIETKEAARGVLKDTSNWFYGIGALQIIGTFWAGYPSLITGIIFIVLAFLLRKLNSRVVAVLMLILSALNLVFFFYIMIWGGKGGGNLFIVLGLTWVSIRAVQAAFRLNSLSLVTKINNPQIDT